MTANQPIGHLNMVSEYTKQRESQSSGNQKRSSTGHYYLSSESNRPKIEKKPVEGHKEMGVHPSRQSQERSSGRGHKDIASNINRERQDKPIAGHKIIGSHSNTVERKKSGSIGHQTMNPHGRRKSNKSPPKEPTGHRSMNAEHHEIVSSTVSPKGNQVTYPSDYNYLSKHNGGDKNVSRPNYSTHHNETEQRHTPHLQPYQSRRHTEAILKPTNRVVREDAKLADELKRHQIQQQQNHEPHRPDSTNKRNRHVHFDN